MEANQAGRPRLSVAMIVRDAEEILQATLENVAPIADEILVVDTGSRDGTMAVARRHGAVVHERPWVDDFSHSRNHALALARGEWILWLDAGERLDEEAAKELRQFVLDQADPNRAYMLLVTVPPAGANVAGEQVGRIRLMPNRRDLRFEGRVRESLKASVQAAGLTIEGLPWRIVRGVREHDADVKLLRARRDLALVDLEIRQHGKQPELLLTLGDALVGLNDQAGAVAAYREAIAGCERESSELRMAYYGLLAALDADPSQRETQIAVCMAALAAFPLDAQLLCALGGYLQSQGRLDLAARSYRVAFEHGQVDPETWHVSEIDEIAAVCLGVSLQLLQDDEEARRVFESAIERHPNSERVRRQLLDLEIKHDRRQQALAHCEKLSAEPALRSAVRGACLAARQNWVPAVAYLQTAYTDGCRDPLCLRWLAVALVSCGDTAAAEPVLHEWLAAEPHSVEARQYLSAVTGAAEGSSPGRSLRFDKQEQTAAPSPAPNVGPLSAWADAASRTPHAT